MATKMTYEDFRGALISFNRQLDFCNYQVKKYNHLLNTQSDPGNLPDIIAKYEKIRDEITDLITRHKQRGKRLQLATDAQITAIDNITQTEKR